ncbi:MAG TPA: DoxX family protein [Candidatus Dormibacteraeota bacterium]|nr:DoxX family protein [Candidatus Dormibacteraeota bacterium]
MATSAALSNRSGSLAVASSASGPIVLLGRLLFVLIFLMSGFTHFAKPTIAFAASQGLPMASVLVPFSGILAFVGGLSILLGYRARLGAWLIVIFLIGVTPMHKFWGIADPMMQQMQMAMFMKNLTMLGGALLTTQFGSGPWSLDSRRQ